MGNGLQALLSDAVARGVAPGLSAAYRTAAGEIHLAQAGTLGANSQNPVNEDTRFWIASCSKAVTSVLALQLVEQGLLDLDAPVGNILPVLAHPRVLTGFDAAGMPLTRPAVGEISLRRLLTHTSGLGYDFASEDLGKAVEALGVNLTTDVDPEIPLLFDPGADWRYGIGLDWAARLIETVTGKTLDVLAQEAVLGPLGMSNTSYFAIPADSNNRAGLHLKTPGGFAPIPPSLPATRHFMMGGAGLLSTPADYLKFLTALAKGGQGLMQPQTFALMTRAEVEGDHVGVLNSSNPMVAHSVDPAPGQPKAHSLCAFLHLEPGPFGRSEGSLSWAGIANAYYWTDPKTGVAGVIMAQFLPFGDPGMLETFVGMERLAYGAG